MGWQRYVSTLVVCAACSFEHGTVGRPDGNPDGPPGACPADWYDVAWPARIPIAIDPGKVAGALVDFPVLIDIVDPMLRGGSGSDLLFTSGDGRTKLAHQVDRFDGATGALTAWVRVPMLAPDTVSTKLFLYSGNAAAAPQESPGEVWIGGYAAVFHMQETPGAPLRDSTLNARHGTPQGMNAADQVPGKIAGSLMFDGVNNGLDTASFAVGSTFTFEAWVQPAVSSNRWRCIVNNDPLYNRWFGLRDNDVDFWDNSTERIIANSVIQGAVWYHVVATYDGTQLRGYRDGTPGTSFTVTLPAAPSAPLQIGYTVALTTEWFHGRIDELRVSTVARSSVYVTTSFNNQSSPSTFVTPGMAQSCQ